MSLDVCLTIDTCSTCGHGEEAFSANITHNLGKMAAKAGIYDIVWRPDENGIKQAKELIKPLTKALASMKAHPARFRKCDTPNGWGTYDQFAPWLEKYLDACKKFPNATIAVSR